MSKTKFNSVIAKLGEYIEKKQVPGWSAMIAQKSDVEFFSAGLLDLKTETPVQRNSLFRISSMTKPITATAALMLVADGKIDLRDSVNKWLPEFSQLRVLKKLDSEISDTVPCERDITVQDILTFCMGTGLIMAPPNTYPIQGAISKLQIGDGPPLPQVPPEPDEYMKRFASVPLIYQPGQRWMYNTAYEVLGVLISRVTKQTLAEFLTERIFKPLGMIDTGFSVAPDQIHRLATAYTEWGGRGMTIYDSAADGQWSKPPKFFSGAAGLVSTADDYHNFATMLLNKGNFQGHQLLPAELIEEMTKDQLTAEQKKGADLYPEFFEEHGYGFGVSVVTKQITPYHPVGQFHWDGGLGTSWIADPRQNLTAILLTQKTWTSPKPPAIVDDFVRLIYEAL